MSRERDVEELFLYTQNVVRGWKTHFYKVLGSENLSSTLMMMLFQINGTARANGRSIGAALNLSPSAVSQMIDSLDKLGYITRESGTEDRRVTYFGLTAGGKEKVAYLEKKRIKYFMSVTATLTDEEVVVMIKLLQKMQERIKSE
jgi:DNA-binding MarR family transcriptional regulator